MSKNQNGETPESTILIGHLLTHIIVIPAIVIAIDVTLHNLANRSFKAKHPHLYS